MTPAELQPVIDNAWEERDGISPSTTGPVREAIEEYCETHQSEQNGARAFDGGQTVFDAFDRAGLIGCFSGRGDVSTNPKYMEGFGQSD